MGRGRGVGQLSQDKFWEQWNTGSGGGRPPDPAARSAEPGDPASGVDADVLAAWLKSLPPNDPLVPAPTHTPAPAPAPAESPAWPPAAPVDPFAGIRQAAGVQPAEWDLTFESAPLAVPPAPAAPPPALPPAPAAAPGGGFGLDLGGLAGPVPAANPFDTGPTAAPGPPSAPALPPPAAPPAGAAPGIGPFGPPLPPAAPPADSLQAAPLKLQITTGRRTIEQLIRGEALIGRPDATRGLHPEIDLRLDDAVSRRHAKIFVRDGAYVLKDLNSTNGTRHNREWLQAEAEVSLRAGDEIEVGEITLIRILEAPASHA